MTTKQPNAIDVQVGHNIRKIRNVKGMSQEKLGEHLGVSFQQVQKYEKGTNRVSSSKLVSIARALDTDIATLFDGVEGIGLDTPLLSLILTSIIDRSGGRQLLAAYDAMTIPEREGLERVAQAIMEARTLIADNGTPATAAA
ncbi:helix-turn-helix domain-containing protein [Rhodobium gokarnense]|uniref:Transcriptional regulator with XRE-family HTH domain n=1 Tax=Rhodobium gokarnense TaxID=364296 RepID=A0ABT3HH09_9HYPH|nr:helix-turn-helix transcriptional regulator [Rhodobium gokarnense]MCW2309682.1 transcriptional regulator with XRE-family HTH domain [Rhodobium gokarnense]